MAQGIDSLDNEAASPINKCKKVKTKEKEYDYWASPGETILDH